MNWFIDNETYDKLYAKCKDELTETVKDGKISSGSIRDCVVKKFKQHLIEIYPEAKGHRVFNGSRVFYSVTTDVCMSIANDFMTRGVKIIRNK